MMITIDNIEKKLHFPVIDFKFQNRGDATAILWEFNVNVREAKLDISPSLEFSYSVQGDSLTVYAKNRGYGKACNCAISLSQPYLTRIFNPVDLSFTGDIPSGKTVEIMVISLGPDSEGKFLEVLRAISGPGNSYHLKSEYIQDAIRIDDIHVDWTCKNENGQNLNGGNSVRSLSTGELLLTKSGFLLFPHHVSYCMMEPSQIYCVMIDIEKGSQLRKYPISRKIAPGDVDRFHIMIGANKSSIINLDFSFKIDSGINIRSDEFRIDIWNPLESGFYHSYVDAEILEAEIKASKDKKNGFWYDYEMRKLKDLREDHNYPFLTKSKRDYLY